MLAGAGAARSRSGHDSPLKIVDADGMLKADSHVAYFNHAALSSQRSKLLARTTSTTALDVPGHAFAPCALHVHPPELARSAG